MHKSYVFVYTHTQKHNFYAFFKLQLLNILDCMSSCSLKLLWYLLVILAGFCFFNGEIARRVFSCPDVANLNFLWYILARNKRTQQVFWKKNPQNFTMSDDADSPPEREMKVCLW